jgi:ElaB/YqjD/DUF883 family membrane-anchored ribosome-binding protein
MTDRQTEEQERELVQPREGARTASAGGDPSPEKDPEQLQHEIDEARAELGDTVDALAQKADVKARVSEKAEQRKAALRERQEDIRARVSGARERVSRTTPDDAKHAASQVARTAEKRPFPAIVVALGLGLLVGRAIGRR